MKSDRNPRADAKLKRLADPLKDEILRRCLEPGVRQSTVLEWIAAECGVACSAAVLSDFVSWWPARKRAMADEAAVEAWMEHAKEADPSLTEEELFRKGQSKFAKLAISRDDPKTWAVTTMAADSRERIELERTKNQQRAELLTIKREELSVKQHLAELAERRVVLLENKLRAISEAVTAAKTAGGLTPETLAKIEEAAKIL